MFRFSVFLFVSKSSTLFSNYIVRFVVGFFLALPWLPISSLHQKLVGAVGSFLSGMFIVLFPFASELGAQEDKARIKGLFLGASRLFAALSIPLIPGTMCCLAPNSNSVDGA